METQGEEPDTVREVAGLIARLQEATAAVDEAAAGYLGVNPTDLRCLGLIGRRPRTLGDLALATNRTPAAITVAVDRLAGAGLARRVPDPGDRRRILVEPTERAWQEIATIWEPIGDEGTAQLSRYTGAEREFLASFLRDAIALQDRHTARLTELTGAGTCLSREASATPPRSTPRRRSG